MNSKYLHDGCYENNIGISIHLTDDCNLKCKYCYLRIKGKEVIDEILCFEKVEKIILSNIDNLNVQFTGGEPLLEWSKIEYLHEKIYESSKNSNVKCFFSIQTNGTLLSEQKFKWLSDKNFTIGISLDGSKELHDKFRKTSNGSGSYNQIDLNYISLNEKENIRVNSVYNPSTIDSLTSSTDSLYKQGFRWIVPKINFMTKWNKNDLIKLEQEYFKLCDWYSGILNGTDVPIIRPIVDRMVSLMKNFGLNGCGAGNNLFAITPNLEIVPCSLWWALNRNQQKFGNDDIESNLPCEVDSSCNISRCSNACEAFRIFNIRNSEVLCVYERSLTNCARKLLDNYLENNSIFYNVIINADKDFCKCFLV